MKQPGQTAAKLVSIIVPIGARRAQDIKALYDGYKSGVAGIGMPFEFIFVLDCVRCEVQQALEELLREGENFTIVRLTRHFGEAAALMAGFEHANGQLIVTLPA